MSQPNIQAEIAQAEKEGMVWDGTEWINVPEKIETLMEVLEANRLADNTN